MTCPICLEFFESPKETPCHHVYCKSCIENYLEKQSTCPDCRQPLSKGQLAISSFERLVNKLEVYCSNKIHKNCKQTKGCNWKGHRMDLQTHLENDCCHNFCENSAKGCPYEGSKKQLKLHIEEECEYVLISCPKKCEVLVQRNSIEEHIKNSCAVTLKEIEDAKRQKEEKEKAEKEKKLKEKAMEFQKLCDLLNPDPNDVISIKINNSFHTTSKTTLTKFPESFFGILFSERERKLQKDSNGNVVLDIDEKIFAVILNWLRT